jgi:hypothetical protein
LLAAMVRLIGARRLRLWQWVAVAGFAATIHLAVFPLWGERPWGPPIPTPSAGRWESRSSSWLRYPYPGAGAALPGTALPEAALARAGRWRRRPDPGLRLNRVGKGPVSVATVDRPVATRGFGGASGVDGVARRWPEVCGAARHRTTGMYARHAALQTRPHPEPPGRADPPICDRCHIDGRLGVRERLHRSDGRRTQRPPRVRGRSR